MRRFFFGLAVFALTAPTPLFADTTDREIAKQIVDELKSQKESGELRGFNLDLQVEDGSVYLKGFVSEREQRRKAVAVAQRVEGVKRVFNEIEIKSAESITTTQRPLTRDVAPAKQLKAELLSELEIAPDPPQVGEPKRLTPKARPVAPQVAIDLSQGDELESAGSSEENGEIGGLLEAVVKKVPANIFRTPRKIEVSNEQAIESSEDAVAPSSREITAQIVDQYRTAMNQGKLHNFGIDVQVDQGVVWLKGTVAEPAHLDYAIDVASNVRGVKRVVNRLTVTSNQASEQTQLVSHDGSDEGVQHAFRQETNSRASGTDSERIAKEVVTGLQERKQDGRLVNFGIDVQVDQRIVWMSGYVSNEAQKAQALSVAQHVRGVEKVVNDLHVRGQGTPLRPVSATLPQTAAPQPGQGQQLMNYRMVPVQYMPMQNMQPANQTPMAFAPAARPVNHTTMQPGQPVPMTGNNGVGIAPARFDHPQMPGYAWPSYAPHPNYGAVTYPKQYSPSAWPYIGPFYPYPQVPLGWRRVTLEWDDGWWNLKFKNTHMH